MGAERREWWDLSRSVALTARVLVVKLLVPPLRPRLRAEGDHSQFAKWKQDDRVPTVHGPPPSARVQEYATL